MCHTNRVMRSDARSSIRPAFRQAVLVLGAGLTSLAATPAALAADPLTQTPTGAEIHVSYAGLDLATSQGAAILYSRLRAAASKVCGDYPVHAAEASNWRFNASMQRCYQDALSQSIAKVNAPQLTALYSGTVVRARSAPARTEEGGGYLPVAAQ